MSGFFGGGSVQGLEDLRASVAYNFFLDAVDHGRDVIAVAGGRVDEFETQSGVDDVASTGETYDATGDYYHNPGSETSENSGAAMSTFQNNPTSYVHRSFAVDNSKTVTAMALTNVNASGNAKLMIVLENSATNFTVVHEETFAFDNSGLQKKTFASSYQVPASGTYRAAVYVAYGPHSISGSTFAASYKSGELTGTEEISAGPVQVPELTVYYTEDAPVLEIISEAQTAAAVPDTGYVTAWIEPRNGGTVNTDFGVDVSRDDGATWDAVDLEVRGALSVGSIYFGDVAFTGAASDQMRWRAWANAGTEIRLHAMSDNWGTA